MYSDVKNNGAHSNFRSYYPAPYMIRITCSGNRDCYLKLSEPDIASRGLVRSWSRACNKHKHESHHSYRASSRCLIRTPTTCFTSLTLKTATMKFWGSLQAVWQHQVRCKKRYQAWIIVHKQSDIILDRSILGSEQLHSVPTTPCFFQYPQTLQHWRIVVSTTRDADI